uniref:Large ribosomal subunit protein mL52 n=1 Tax=Dicentrarchus labrax TaxID=13489 RepID=A0A8C4EA24_DICLA
MPVNGHTDHFLYGPLFLIIKTINNSLVTVFLPQVKWLPWQGLARSGTEYGPMTDLPDWSYADGRPAPLMKGQLRRKQEREDLARRIVMLSTEMDRGMEAWREKQEAAKSMEEDKKSLLLKPKGSLLMKKKPQS